MTSPTRRRQEGQVLVITALMTLVILVGILVGYDIGRLVLARIKFQNGADAAALAAVAVKLEKHHFDASWRWGMQQEAYLADAAAGQAKVQFVRTLFNVQSGKYAGVLPGPGGPPGAPPAPIPVPPQLKDDRKIFAERANRAYRHAAKLRDMEKTLYDLYDDWPQTFRAAADEAAQIAWQMNIAGFESHTSPAGQANRAALSSSSLLENVAGFGNHGGIPYANEGTVKKQKPPTFGKSAVELEAYVEPFSGAMSFIKAPRYAIRVNAAAQPIGVGQGAPQDVNGRYEFDHVTALGKGGGLGAPKMQWHQPALMNLAGDKPGVVEKVPYH